MNRNKVKGDGWVLSNKAGKLFPETFDVDKDRAWQNAFDYLYHGTKTPWMRAFYNQLDESIEAAKKRGWKLVECKIHII